MFLTVSCPVVLCLITASRHVLVSVLFECSMMAFLMEPSVRALMYPGGRNGMIIAEDLVIFGVFTLLSVLLAAGVGLMFAERRRRAA